MHELLGSPWTDNFTSLVDSARSSLVLCSPFVGKGPCNTVVRKAGEWGDAFRLVFLTNLSRDNMLSGVTDVGAIATVLNAFPKSDIRFLPSLHAKVYVADDQEAVITSANMTDSGLGRNLEYGVRFTDSPSVRAIREDVLHYASLGSPVDAAQLNQFVKIIAELRDLRDSAERTLRTRLRREFERRIRETDDAVIRVRAAGRSASAIFQDAIRHILRAGAATTVEIHRAVQRIHPDLCDDTVDRVIDGQHFGKRWKHAVRSAQSHLKTNGEIEQEGSLWRSRT